MKCDVVTLSTVSVLTMAALTSASVKLTADAAQTAVDFADEWVA